MTLLVRRQEGHPACKKLEWSGTGMVNCLERDADLHMAQLMPLPLTFSCFSKIQIGFTFLVPAHRVVGAGNPKSNGVGKIIPESFHVLQCCMCLLVVSPKISVHTISIGGWLHLKRCWVHTQVTKNCFVVVWLLGTKGDIYHWAHLAKQNSCSGKTSWSSGFPHIYRNL